MDDVTKYMVNCYEIMKKGYDFAGFPISKGNISYHHLVQAARDGGPRTVWNGAILNSKSSHPYVHVIENYDEDMFYAITSEMVDENIKGYLDMENILRIYDIMDQFEREYSGKTTKKGKEIIKPEFTVRMLKR